MTNPQSNVHAQPHHHAEHHADHQAGDRKAHHGPHIVSAKTLLATWGALMVLTALTVAATWIDLGHTGNLVVAMVVATIKALIVALIFMHLWFDQKFNLVIFVVSVLGVVLFVAVTFIDVSSYQPDVDKLEETKPGTTFVQPATPSPAQP